MESLMDRFYLSFIYEDRWKFFLDGFWMTLLLTAASFVLGSLLGALLCAMKLSRRGWLRKTVNTVISVLVKMPTMVLLMFFVYIIFGSAPLSVVVIVIFGLTLKAGAYISEVFYTAVTAVARGEVEAAHTLGLTRLQVFRYITLPQAVSMALPVYKNQFVITLQETSIVGYLAILDLTRASDVIISRTLDALLGLVVISVIYLLIGYLGGLLLDLLEKKKHLGGEAA